MKGITRWALLSALLFAPWLAKGEETDFFSRIGTELGRSASVEMKSAELTGKASYRLHYAIDDQQGGYNFRREKADVGASRMDLKLQWDSSPFKTLDVRFSGLASYDDKLASNKNDHYIDESFADWLPAPQWRLKIGRQLMVFGESNYFQILDVMSPLDERVLGLAELEETRLPIFGTRLSYASPRFTMDIFLAQEFRENFVDEGGGDFDPYIALRGSQVLVLHAKPDVRFNNPDGGVRLFFPSPWGDISVIFAETHSYRAIPNAYENESVDVIYAALNTTGLAANFVHGDWLLKMEYADQRGNLFLRSDIAEQQVGTGNGKPVVSMEKPLHKLMLGARYAGIRDWLVDVEVLGQFMESYQDLLTDKRLDVSGVVSIIHETTNDRMQFELLWMKWWQRESDLARLRFDYRWDDNISLFAGFIIYESDDANGILSAYRRNDRTFAGISYDF